MGVKFDETFQLSATALKLNRAHPALPLTLKWAVQILLFKISFSLTFMSLVYSSIYHDNFTKICTNFGVGVLFGIICFNSGLLIVYKKYFNEMIKITEQNIEASKKLSFEDELVIKEHTNKGKWAAKLWLTVCVVTGGMFCCKAIAGNLYRYFFLQGNTTLLPIYDVAYPAYIEERKNEFYMYTLIFGIQFIYIVYTALMYLGFNPLGPIFMMQACGQIELAIRQLRRLFLDDKIDMEECVRKLINIAGHIQSIYSFVDLIQQTHKAMYEMCLNTSTIIIPVSCFGIIESYQQGDLSIELICYVCAAFMQCYIPCYYCEVLISKGEELRTAIYGCNWEKQWVPKTRSTILVMLTRTARPLGIHAVFCTVGMAAFADLCNQAYRIFNVLNAAWN